jgi:hypothetical protein
MNALEGIAVALLLSLAAWAVLILAVVALL